jgi:Flp pilus assembly protein TadG
VRFPRLPSPKNNQRLRAARRSLVSDEGAAPVEFALVTPLVLLVALAVLQLTLALHVRSVAIGAASEGARLAAISNVEAGRERTTRLLRGSIAGPAIRDTTVRLDRSGPLAVTAVDVTLDLPLIGLLGPVEMTVTGRAVVESTDELVPGFGWQGW